MSTFQISNPSILYHPLRTVAQIINPRCPIPVMTGVLVQITPGGCTVTGSDMEQIIQVKIPEVTAKTETNFVISKKIIESISKLPDTPVLFNVDTEKHVLRMQYSSGAGQAEQKHSIMDADDYMPVPEVEGQTLLVGEIEFKRVNFAAVNPNSKDALARPIFTGVYIDLQRSKVVATDTRRMVVMDVAFPGDADGACDNAECNAGDDRDDGDKSPPIPGVILPVKAVNFISQMDEPVLVVGETGNQVKAVSKDGSTTLISRLIMSQYPNYMMLVNDNKGKYITEVEFDAGEMADAVDRAALVLANDDIGLRFDFRDGVIEIGGLGETGEVREGVACRFSGEPLEAYFSHKLLLDALKYASGDRVTWKLSGKDTPAMIQGEGDKEQGKEWFCMFPPLKPLK